MSRLAVLLSLGFGSVWLCACSKPAPEQATTPDASAAEADIALPADLPTESSLDMKRGRIALEDERARFQACDEATEWPVVDPTDVLRVTFANEPKPLELYVEMYGERADVLANAAGSAPQAAFVVEEVLYAAPASEARGCAEPAPTYVVAARGNEPFWSIEVANDQLTWRQPDAPQELVFDALDAESAEGTVGYQGSADGHSIEVFVTAEPCRDSMSGAYFAYSARATFDDKQLTGCARIGG